MEGQDAVYISTPRIIINEHYLLQGHHLKHNEARKLVFFFPMYTNEIPLPNPNRHLYKSKELTFALESREEASRSSVSGRVTGSRASNEIGSS